MRERSIFLCSCGASHIRENCFMGDMKRLYGSESLIHHSDRECQYTSSDYVSRLRRHNICISMTESGNPKDNAQAECINNTLKNELLKGKVFMSMEEARSAISKAIDPYNNERPHMSIDMMTPSEVATVSNSDQRQQGNMHPEVNTYQS